MAGTWGGEGNQVGVQDANGKSLTIRTNQAGNFYTAESLAFPMQVSVNGVVMSGGLSADQGGSCNRCHAPGRELPGPLMAPGEDCLACHDGAGAKRFTVAGTWPPQGSTVAIADAKGTKVALTTNQVGNFYTAESLAFPLQVSVDGVAMTGGLSVDQSGSCNRCHAPGRELPGPLMAPGQDCLACHDGAGATRFTVAGTWPPQGSTVAITDAKGTTVTLTTNQVGNFSTGGALTFPLTVSVNGQRMPGGLNASQGGSCNRCHSAGGAEDR